MGRRKLTARGDFNIPLICYICGDKARGYNFSVLSCISCKSFFRRHGLLKSENLRCKYQEKCIIAKKTRADCLPCRLKKCLELGMNPLMIRSPFKPKSKKIRQLIITNEIQLPAPRPVKLLETDYSNLTTDQWNLLSNIIYAYDKQNMINQFQYVLDERSSLPPKLRFKTTDTLDLASQLLTGIHPLIEHSLHFQHLSYYARRALILHNVLVTGGLNGYFVIRETNAMQDINYKTVVSDIYGADLFMTYVHDIERLELNGTLVKLMLFVLIFSSNCSVVAFNAEEDWQTMSNSIELILVQDIYVTMLWKYLVYQYGYDHAAIRFSLMIKSVLDLLRRADEASKNTIHNAFVDRIMMQTERLLIVGN